MSMELQELLDLIDKSAQKLLKEWRGDGKSDDLILRDKLIECGWRYSRRNNGGWYHPDAPEVPAPRSLPDLATMIAGEVVRRALTEEMTRSEDE